MKLVSEVRADPSSVGLDQGGVWRSRHGAAIACLLGAWPLQLLVQKHLRFTADTQLEHLDGSTSTFCGLSQVDGTSPRPRKVVW